MPLHIAIDARRIRDFGIGTYIRSLVHALAGMDNKATGWGVVDESWIVAENLRAIGGVSWFQLGDRDLATHLFRTQRLSDGAPLSQVTAELAYERSGPERFMSTFPLLVELLRELGPEPPAIALQSIGRLAAQLWTLRRLSLSVSTSLQAGDLPSVQAGLVKDVGTRFERELTETVRAVAPLDSGPRFRQLLAEAVTSGPGFTLRGGTSEILRGIVARGLCRK